MEAETKYPNYPGPNADINKLIPFLVVVSEPRDVYKRKPPHTVEKVGVFETRGAVGLARHNQG